MAFVCTGVSFCRGFLLPLLLLFFLVSGCVKNITGEELFGKWHAVEGAVTVSIEFFKTGEFEGSVFKDGVEFWKARGTWKVADNKIIYHYTNSSSTRVPIGAVDIDKIVSIGDNNFTIKDKSGFLRTYSRF